MSDALASQRRWPAPVRALAHRDYRLYFFGQGLSILGSWIQQVGLSWLIYTTTGSSLLLGSVQLAALAPQLVLGPLVGALAENRDKRLVLMVVQGLLALQSLVLALLTLTGHAGTAAILGMSLVLGILNSFDGPLRQTAIVSFVADRRDLPNALALNAMLLNLGRFVGPPVAGLLLAASNAAACFAVNSLSFLGLLLGLALMRAKERTQARQATLSAFRAGIAHVVQTPRIRLLVGGVVVLNATAASYSVLLPLFVGHVFSGDGKLLGWLWGSAGLGALLATVAIAGLGERLPPARLIGGSFIACVPAMVTLATSHWLPASLAAMLVLGFSITGCNVSTNITLQAVVEDAMRSRVIAVYLSGRLAAEALGGFVIGWIAAALGPSGALSVAAALLAGFILYLKMKHDGTGDLPRG